MSLEMQVILLNLKELKKFFEEMEQRRVLRLAFEQLEHELGR